MADERKPVDFSRHSCVNMIRIIYISADIYPVEIKSGEISHGTTLLVQPTNASVSGKRRSCKVDFHKKVETETDNL